MSIHVIACSHVPGIMVRQVEGWVMRTLICKQKYAAGEQGGPSQERPDEEVAGMARVPGDAAAAAS